MTFRLDRGTCWCCRDVETPRRLSLGRVDFAFTPTLFVCEDCIAILTKHNGPEVVCGAVNEAARAETGMVLVCRRLADHGPPHVDGKWSWTVTEHNEALSFGVSA